jgi:hypothetical protein
MAPVVRGAMVLVGLLSLKTCTYVPNSKPILEKSGGGAPVTIVMGLSDLENSIGSGELIPGFDDETDGFFDH